MKNSRIMVAMYVVTVLLGILFALPNVIPAHILERYPAFMPTSKVALGLDLRGGAHMVLEVDSADLQKERIRILIENARRTMREADIAVSEYRAERQGVSVSLREASQRDQAVEVLRSLSNSSGLTRPDLEVVTRGATQLAIVLTEEGLQAAKTSAAEQSLEIIRQRVDQVGVAEPTIQRVGADRILVQLPGLQDPSELRTLLGSTAKMSFHMLGELGDSDVRVLEDDKANAYPVQANVELSGDRLSDAWATFDPNTNEPVVNFRFDGVGGRQFAQITRDNVGKPFAIVLDDKVLSAPVIREAITGGSGQISGNFTMQEASTLSALLRAGALPAKLTVIEERNVGADLGSDVIEKGVYAGIAAFALVFMFMLALYGTWGLVANLALGLNITLTLACLTLLGATLTLPGIAGIVLGIGLAVDANVLINERIREETRKGRGALGAIDLGFKKAYATILDSNVTALIATILLFWFGSGPVRGFAVTMAIGLVISMFTAVSIVKVVMIAIARNRRLKTINIKPLFGFRLLKDGTRVDFMKARFIGLAVSLLLSVGAIGVLVKPGLNFGIDFKGGIQVEVKTSAPPNLSELRARMDSLGMGEVSLQEFDEGSRVLVRVERQPGGEKEQTHAVEVLKSTLISAAPGAVIERSEVVGPKVSGELATAGILSVVLASVAMLIYIWIRFEWPFAVGAIVTLILDVTKTAGFFALMGLDFNLTAIAALLTLVGYSVNDKVVVYDRMRENMRLQKTMSLRDIINLSINETLARSLYTSATALLAMLPLAIWGGSAVESFAVPMVFGIIVAATSSVFIAAPILLMLGDWRKRRKHVFGASESTALS